MQASYPQAMKTRILKISAGLGAAALLALGGAAIARATGALDDAQLTGSEADRAKAAALAITDGGRANAVERDSENGATYEVEVTRTDGSTVDVRLDENFKLVVIEGDSEANDSDDG
jgi:uncharacterized membrane protein YkoI